jgi:hypothetical protein
MTVKAPAVAHDVELNIMGAMTSLESGEESQERIRRFESGVSTRVRACLFTL